MLFLKHPQTFYPQSHWINMRKLEISFFNAFIVLSTFANTIIFTIRLWSDFNAARLHESSYSYDGDDFPEHLPADARVRSSIPMTIQIDPDTFPITAYDAIDQWQTIYPEGYGFVRLGDSSRILCIAMFHQLHCIEKMRVFLDNPNAPHVGFEHQHHCTNYLRQSFLCKGDTTLEPIDLSGIASTKEINDLTNVNLSTRSGSGLTRSCADWETIHQIAEENYLRWKSSWNITNPFENTDD